jgi:hypothetical protein
MESLTKATSAYEGVIQSSHDDRQRNRAQLGLARVYEMQGKLDTAREAYSKVGGGYKQYAEMQADRLAQPKAKETYAWLESARPALPRAPWGPGTPGERPAFSEGDFALPGVEGAPGTPGAGGPAMPAASIEDLLKGLELDFETPAAEEDRYAPGTTAPATTEGTPEGSESAPPVEGVTPPATETELPASESAATEVPSSPAPGDGPGEDEASTSDEPAETTDSEGK